ncbi:MAG TPA: hypothetical protein VFE63_03250 [Roseiarcus sp.]|jgi:hypothetical protein|nr:hypothetical protein [Roseiarcus sp.]
MIQRATVRRGSDECVVLRAVKASEIEAELVRLARKLHPGARPESPRPRETFAEGLIPLKGRLIPASVRRRRAINVKGRAA